MPADKSAKKNKDLREPVKEPGEQSQPQEHKDITITFAQFEELKRKAEERDLYYDKYVRAHAEFDNARKRMAKEKEDYSKYANEELILELLGVLDVFQKAFDSANNQDDFKTLKVGVGMILKDVAQFLKQRGVEKIDSRDKMFDPHVHEAVSFTFNKEKPEGVIIEEVKTGYVLNGKVIRPAMVIVNKLEQPQ